jgi:hypothetical protein
VLAGKVFNAVVFRAEAAAYDADGIDWDPTTFPDNAAVVDLLSAKPLGLLPMLDSQCSRGHAASDGAALVRAYAKVHAPAYAHASPSSSSSGPKAACTNSSLGGGRDNHHGVAHSCVFTAGGLSSGLRKGGGEDGGTSITLQRTVESDFAVTHYAGVVIRSLIIVCLSLLLTKMLLWNCFLCTKFRNVVFFFLSFRLQQLFTWVIRFFVHLILSYSVSILIVRWCTVQKGSSIETAMLFTRTCKNCYRATVKLLALPLLRLQLQAEKSNSWLIPASCLLSSFQEMLLKEFMSE